MECLLECIGFPPDHDLGALVQRIREEGESVAWRGPAGLHLRFPFPGGVEVRLDREEGLEAWTLWPHFEVARRLRVGVRSVTPLPDSPYDVLLRGIANPPLPGGGLEEEAEREDYVLSTYLSDARRLPAHVPRDHVLAVSIAGFALDVSYVGPDEGVRDVYVVEEPQGSRLVPVAASDDLAGAMAVSLVVRAVHHTCNPITGEVFHRLEVDAPGRPLDLFLSRWALEGEDLDVPRPGARIEGTFVFTGRVAGGLPPATRRTGSSFG